MKYKSFEKSFCIPYGEIRNDYFGLGIKERYAIKIRIHFSFYNRYFSFDFSIRRTIIVV